MSLFVDTSVWSRALRRDEPERDHRVSRLARALDGGEPVFTTGLVMQELLQGMRGPKAFDALAERLSVLPFIIPDRRDHVDAAKLRNGCRRKGIQVGTIDALLAGLCIRHELTMLTADEEIVRLARVTSLDVWTPTARG